MIASLGLAALWLAAALAAVELVAAMTALREPSPDRIPIVRAAATVQAALAAAAFAALMVLFGQTDLSVKLVAEASHPAKPIGYAIADSWSSVQGMVLLGAAILGLAGASIAWFERRLDQPVLLRALAAHAGLGLGIYAAMLVAANPFVRLDPAAGAGSGLYPLHQNAGFAVYPALLCAGYAGLAIVGCLVLGALAVRGSLAVYTRVVRPWLLGSWVLLTLGITARAYGIYAGPGHGGWWLWDGGGAAMLLIWGTAGAALHLAFRRERPRLAWRSWPGGLRLATLPRWGAAVAHCGAALVLFGLAADALQPAQRSVQLRIGEEARVGPWAITLRTITPVAGPNWTALEAELAVSHGGARTSILKPQARSFWSPPQQIGEPALVTRWNGQLYTELGDQALDGRWPLYVWWRPFVQLIWAGGVLAALGGLLALAGAVGSAIRRRVAGERIAYRRMRQGR